MASGRAIAIVFALLITVAAGIVFLYKMREMALPETSISFTVATPPENATVHALEYRPVHAAYYLEDHLDTALDKGSSVEGERLRVENMHGTLQALTGSPGPEWWLLWKGQTVHAVLS